jgi:uncharacterized protein with LGFP repeats
LHLLGLPTSDVIVNPDGVSQFARFQGGLIYSHPDAGTGTILGDIYERWLREGGESGELGYPTSRERRLVDDSYHWATFQNGTIVWEKARDQTFEVKWLINAKWQAKGGISGLLGAPLRDEEFIPGGVV